MGPRRGLLMLAGAVWAALLAWSLVHRTAGLAARLPDLGASPERRAEVESGDPDFHRLLVDLGRRIQTGDVLLLVTAPPPPAAFFYRSRSAYELYPVRVRYHATAVRPPERGGVTVRGDPGLAQLLAEHPAAVCGWFVPAEPAQSGVFDVRVASGSVRLTRAAPAVSPGGSRDREPSLARAALIVIVAALLVGLVAVGTPRPPRGVLDGLGVVLVASAAGLAIVQAVLPLNAWHHWDGWCTWGFKAKAWWLAGGVPTGFLADPAYDYSNPQYPPGLPLTAVVLGLLAGGLDDSVFRLACFGYFLVLIVLVARLLADLGVTRHRWLLAGLFALVPKVLDFGVNGYAEVPVAAASTATLILLLAAERGTAPAWSVGLMAGIAGNLKHEGLVVAAAAMAVLAFDAVRGRAARGGLPLALAALAVMLVPWRLVGAARHGMGVAQFLPGRALEEAPDRLLRAAWGATLEAWGPGATLPGVERGAPEWGLWPAAIRDHWLLFWWAVTAALAAGWRRLLAPPLRVPAFVLGAEVAAVGAVYAWSPLNLSWLVVASVDRVLVLLSPLAFCLACACVARRGGEPPA